MSITAPGIPPRSITGMLRVENVAALAAAVTAYWFLGGNWWLFAILLLAPDLTFLAAFAGEKALIRTYNLLHTYTLPAVLGAIGWFGGVFWLVEVALIWASHIAVDRSIGYGLKYPESIHHTHLGPMGKARKDAKLANAG